MAFDGFNLTADSDTAMAYMRLSWQTQQGLQPAAAPASCPVRSGLVERDAEGAVRFRQVGDWVRDRLGHDPTGLPVGLVFHPGARARADALLAELFETRGVLLMTVEDGARTGQFAFIPLSQPGQPVARAAFVLSLPDAPDASRLQLRFSRARLSPMANARQKPQLRVIQGGRV